MNYKIIGGDSREYGPVSAEQLRQWMAEGRLNAQTLVQPEGQTGWQPLSAYPELMPPGAATVAPSTGLPGPEAAPAAPQPIRGSLPAQPWVTGTPQPGERSARDVRVPAILLLIAGGLGVLHAVLGLARLFPTPPLPPELGPLGPQLARWLAAAMSPSAHLLDLAISAVIFFGGLSMLRLQYWGLAVATCIIGMLCGYPCCCPIGLVGGIWGLVVLFRPEVKSAFH